MESEIIPLARQGRFRFACHARVPCFNACCRDLNQALAPYDILQLRTHLKLDSATFLSRYTQSHQGPTTGVPIITLKPGPGAERPCPFVTPGGCAVYPARPASCRFYPLMRGVQRATDRETLQIRYALLKEPHCRGFEHGHSQSVAQWIGDQELAPYNAMNDRLAALIDRKHRQHPAPLDLRQSHLFRMALYDLDRFHRYLFKEGHGERLAVDAHLQRRTRQDSVALLELGFAWIEENLF